MKFKDYKYERPNIDEICSKTEELTTIIKEAKDINVIVEAIKSLNKMNSEYSTVSNLAFIRNSIDTTDEYYEKEIEYLNEEGVKVSSKSNELTKVLVNHPLRKDLENVYGSYWFKQMELSLKCFDDCIMEDLVNESKLSIQYDKLMASAKIEFDGKINNLAQMRVYTSSVYRETRIAAFKAVNQFLLDNSAEIDDIYDKLVKTRHTIAKKLGYDNYIELGYA